MKLVILDWATMTNGDLAPNGFRTLVTEMECHASTKPEEAAERIGNAELVLCNKVPMTREVMES